MHPRLPCSFPLDSLGRCLVHIMFSATGLTSCEFVPPSNHSTSWFMKAISLRSKHTRVLLPRHDRAECIFSVSEWGSVVGPFFFWWKKQRLENSSTIRENWPRGVGLRPPQFSPCWIEAGQRVVFIGRQAALECNVDARGGTRGYLLLTELLLSNLSSDPSHRLRREHRGRGGSWCPRRLCKRGSRMGWLLCWPQSH